MNELIQLLDPHLEYDSHELTVHAVVIHVSSTLHEVS
ncbi:protein of unknown function [Bacillus velezensis UCMB5113]|nr:protein of unknown function [Bacillus velezensis UCMB5113]